MKTLRNIGLGLLALLAIGIFYKSDREFKKASGYAICGAAFFGMLNVRTLRDANLSVSVALPAAGANVTSVGIDTAVVDPGRVGCVELLVEVPATPSLVDAKNLTLTVYDSADGVTYAAMAGLPSIVVTGAGGVGAAAIGDTISNGATTNGQFKLPITARRYLAIFAAVDAAGGSNIAISAKLSLVF